METRLPEPFRSSPEGREAEALLRACVHCGFCTAACPTYRLLGDEDDGPRGRIYLIKKALEEGRAGRPTREHLDRCLLCRACESACPSGVRYHRLLAVARPRIARQAPAPLGRRLVRAAALALLPGRRRARAALAMARALRPILPARLSRHLPRGRSRPLPRPLLRRSGAHARRVLLFQGCVEPAALPGARAAAARLLERLGLRVETLPREQCCGALELHLDAAERARRRARANLRLWAAWLENGGEAIVGLSSACVLQIREYPELLAGEGELQALARRVAGRCLELGQLLARPDLALDLPPASAPSGLGTLVWHPPCTLEHGLGDPETIPRLLERLGYRVLRPAETACCGAAGAYFLLQPAIAERLGEARRAALEAGAPQAIVTANVGCLLHLQRPGGPPVRHWAEAAEEALRAAGA